MDVLAQYVIDRGYEINPRSNRSRTSRAGTSCCPPSGMRSPYQRAGTRRMVGINPETGHEQMATLNYTHGIAQYPLPAACFVQVQVFAIGKDADRTRDHSNAEGHHKEPDKAQNPSECRVFRSGMLKHRRGGDRAALDALDLIARMSGERRKGITYLLREDAEDRRFQDLESHTLVANSRCRRIGAEIESVSSQLRLGLQWRTELIQDPVPSARAIRHLSFWRQHSETGGTRRLKSAGATSVAPSRNLRSRIGVALGMLELRRIDPNRRPSACRSYRSSRCPFLRQASWCVSDFTSSFH